MELVDTVMAAPKGLCEELSALSTPRHLWRHDLDGNLPCDQSRPDQLVKIVATTSAVGIIVDAVIVRTLLVPAIVALMGRWNWWVPSGLAKIVGVERA
jgi:MMPL family